MGREEIALLCETLYLEGDNYNQKSWIGGLYEEEKHQKHEIGINRKD